MEIKGTTLGTRTQQNHDLTRHHRTHVPSGLQKTWIVPQNINFHHHRSRIFIGHCTRPLTAHQQKVLQNSSRLLALQNYDRPDAGTGSQLPGLAGIIEWYTARGIDLQDQIPIRIQPRLHAPFRHSLRQIWDRLAAANLRYFQQWWIKAMDGGIYWSSYQ